MPNAKGIVLIVVLILLQILALLGMYALEMSQLENKMSENSWRRYTMLSMTESALQIAETGVVQQIPVCMIPITPSNDLYNRPLNWWNSSATCTGNFQSIEYHYVVELLGRDSCAYLETDQISAEYYRVSILGRAKNKNSIMRLQSTVILPRQSDSSDICLKIKHRVTEGRQMWREMNG
jgi:Tfp pilus assembly protein PilX